MFERAVSRAAWGLVLVGVVLASGIAVARYRLELADRYVEIVVDGRAAKARAAQQGVPYVQLLKTLKQNGATAVAVAEQDLSAGATMVATGAELRRQAAVGTVAPAVMEQLSRGTIVDGYTYVQASRPDIGTTLVARLGREHVRELTQGIWEIAYAQDRVAQFTLGFDQADFQVVREAGLRPVPRPTSYPGITAQQVAETFAALDRLAPETRAVIFQGNEVLGFPAAAAVATTAEALRTRQWVLGLVAKAQGPGYIVQLGQEQLTELVGYRVARVSTGGGATGGARILYVKPGADPVADVRQAASSLERLGLLSGVPHGFAYLHTGRMYQALLLVGVAGAVTLVLLGLFRLRGRALGLWSLALVAGAVLWPFAAPSPQAAGWGASAAIAAFAALGAAIVVSQVNDPATAGPRGVSGVGWFAAAGLAGGVLAQAITNRPTLLLGMAPPPPVWLAPALALALAAGGYAWAQRRRLAWDIRVTVGHLGMAAAIALAVAVTVRYPAWGALWLGGAALVELPGLSRIGGLAAGVCGAVALALAPAGQAWVAALGVGIGLVIPLFLTFRSAAALAQARPAGEGRPYHG